MRMINPEQVHNEDPIIPPNPVLNTLQGKKMAEQRISPERIKSQPRASFI